MSGKVVSFLNMKGGVCKTTLCKEMALFLVKKMAKNVLVIDIDPQSNCTQSFFERYGVLQIEEGDIIKENLNLPSIENIFTRSRGRLGTPDMDKIIYPLEKGLNLIPGDLNTVFMERETGTGAAEQKLLNFINQHNLRKQYDYIFIDCPPTYSFYTVSALLASDYYLVPLRPDAYSLLGLDLLERVVQELRETYVDTFSNKPIVNLGVILTKVYKNPNKGVIKNIEQIIETFSEKDIYFFDNRFINMEKISTGKLSTFILDRDDNELTSCLQGICYEFEERVTGLNG